jgi:hypothetical protein
MKSFLTYSALIEASTGFALILAPSKTVLLLFRMELNGSLEMTLARVAGAAIFSLAIVCWLIRKHSGAHLTIKAMSFYNFAVAAILLYAALGLGFTGPVLWIVIVFHFIQTAIGILLISKKENAN